MEKTMETSRDERYIGYLERLDRAALAALRKGLADPPGRSVGMYRYVQPWLGKRATGWREDAYYLVAALFASHRMSWPHAKDRSSERTDLGASFARIAVGDSREAVERRFTALLNAPGDDLYIHLRHAVSLLKAKDAPVDWVRLLRDLSSWNHEDRWVQRNWARTFWGEIAGDSSGASPDTE